MTLEVSFLLIFSSFFATIFFLHTRVAKRLVSTLERVWQLGRFSQIRSYIIDGMQIAKERSKV